MRRTFGKYPLINVTSMSSTVWNLDDKINLMMEVVSVTLTTSGAPRDYHIEWVLSIYPAIFANSLTTTTTTYDIDSLIDSS